MTVLQASTIHIEAMNIQVKTNNSNRDGGFTLSQALYPVTNMLKQSTERVIKKYGQAKQVPDSAH
jgi:hypothetical protein